MDPIGIRRPVRMRSRVAPAALGAAVLSLAACSQSMHDGFPQYQAKNERERTTRESDDGPVARSPRKSAGEFTRIESAIRRFAGDRAGRLPVSLYELTAERSPDGDHYLTSIPTDAWGRPYSYGVVSARLGSYDLRSYGPDTLPDTADDIVADAKPVSIH